MSATASRRTRAELVAEYRALLGEGLTVLEIAERYGRSYSAVANLLADPDGAKQRSRRKRYEGTCSVCGARTTGCNGRDAAPTLCAEHAREQQREVLLYWTRERILAAIHEWVEEYGRRPVATDWLRQVEGSLGQYVKAPRSQWVGSRRWPPVSSVQREFGSWANALEAAGLGYPQSADRLRPEEWRRHIREGQHRRHGFARGYGALVHVGFHVGSEQLEAVKRLDPELPVSEHIRRALDHYLAAADQAGAEDPAKPLRSAEGSDSR